MTKSIAETLAADLKAANKRYDELRGIKTIPGMGALISVSDKKERERAAQAARIAELEAALPDLITAALCYFEEVGHANPEGVPCIVKGRAALAGSGNAGV